MATYAEILPQARELANIMMGADRITPKANKMWNDFEDYLLGKITLSDADEIVKRAHLEALPMNQQAAMVIISILD